jgi:hypothetical protein
VRGAHPPGILDGPARCTSSGNTWGARDRPRLQADLGGPVWPHGERLFRLLVQDFLLSWRLPCDDRFAFNCFYTSPLVAQTLCRRGGFLRHGEIYCDECWQKFFCGTIVRERRGLLACWRATAPPVVIAVSFPPAIPQRVAPQQSPPPLHRVIVYTPSHGFGATSHRPAYRQSL